MFRKKKERKRNRYVGKLPVNARITIDYTKKNKVKFGYPRKDSAFQVIFSLPTIIPAFAMLVLTMILFQYMTDDFGLAVDYPEMNNCQTYFVHPKGETYLTGLHLECKIDGKMYTMKTTFDRGGKFTLFKDQPELKTDRSGLTYQFKDQAQLVYTIVGFFMIIILLPFFVWLVYLFYTRTKIGQRIFPEIGKSLSDARYYAKFDKVPKNKQIEIPLFKNIYLDYKATKGFSKNLIRMEIIEHPFTQIVRKGKRREKITKTKKQVYLWKAVFYFKQIPKDGQLEMWWT